MQSDQPIEDRERLLRGSTIFEGLDQATRLELAGFAHVKRYAAGAPIFRKGDPGASMMAIASGAVRISLITPSAREVVLTELSAGDVFGEVAMLDGGERSADATAATNCSLVVLERRTLLRLIERNPGLAVRIVELLCARLRRSDERMIDIAFLDLPAKLAKALLRATAGGATPAVRTSLSQTELANRIGASRENVNRCLKGWQRAGLVELRDGWVVISRRAALESLVQAE
jgi:CRP/FNR family cyclic AMP-dependent transcriptional regulator